MVNFAKLSLFFAINSFAVGSCAERQCISDGASETIYQDIIRKYGLLNGLNHGASYITEFFDSVFPLNTNIGMLNWIKEFNLLKGLEDGYSIKEIMGVVRQIYIRNLSDVLPLIRQHGLY